MCCCILKILLHYPNYKESYLISYNKHILCRACHVIQIHTFNFMKFSFTYKIRNHHYKVINPPKYRLRAITMIC